MIYVLSNTEATFEAQFMTNLCNTEAELKKKRCLEKQTCTSVKFNVCISQLTATILLRRQSLNEIRHCLTGHIQI